MSKRGHGETCTYCKRGLESVTSRSRVAATRDHVVPKSKGGQGVTVWACRQCNAIKKDMSPEDWADFMQCFPEWWKHPDFQRFGAAFTRRGTYTAPTTYAGAPLPREESMYILKHGKKAWREKKAQEAAGRIPETFPKVYDDPKAQAGFEHAYKDRLYLLRVPSPEE